MADHSVRGSRWWVVVLPTLLQILISAGFSCAQTCNSQDNAALLELKAGLIDKEGSFATWNDSSDCCTWLGVTCGNGRVVELKMNAFFSPGSPVRDPAYSGQVGATLGNLSSLETLNLENVHFNGEIPDSLGNLVNLKILKLRQAGLQGNIPDSLCNLTQIRSLDLSDNEITGPVPACLWDHIRSIRLAVNNLSGKIPESLANLSTLVELDLATNELEGRIPRSLQKLQNLEILSLSLNQLNGRIPSSLTALKSLRVVALDHNRFTDGISSWWYRLENLTDLELNDNQLGGLIYLPKSNERSSPLRTLLLRNNKFSGRIPDELGNFRGTIDLSNNELTGDIPESLGNNTFGTLLLSGNQLTGGFPLSLSRLQIVKINENKLDTMTAIGSVATDGFNVISELELRGNQLAGPWPTWVSELVNLTSLDLSRNNITGEVPVSLLTIESLNYYLNVSHNPLNFPIPCGDFVSNLAILDLTNTGLTGNLNATFFRSFHLISSLYLGENYLSGELPSNLPSILNPSFNVLDVSNNGFTGSVPRFFDLHFIMYLDLLGNGFKYGSM